MRNLLFTNCTKKDHELFFLTTFMGRGFLAKMNVDSGRIDYCDIMSGFDFEKTSAVMDFFENFQSKIYALDSYGNNLVVFDLIKNQCQYVPLKCNCQKWSNFVAFERYEMDFYIFPRAGKRIIIFDIEKNEVKNITKTFGGGRHVQCICRRGNEMWILPENANQIYCYDLVDKKEEAYELGRTLRGCVHSIYSNNFLYILNANGAVYRWNIEKSELHEVKEPETIHDKSASMSRIIYAGNRLIILPGYGSHIQLFDVLTGRKTLYNEYPKDFEYQTKWIKYYGYCEDERYFYFAASSANYLLMIEKQGGGMTWIKVDKDSLREKTLELFHEAGVNLFHEGGLDITDLLQLNALDNCQANNDSIGKKIYDVLT